MNQDGTAQYEKRPSLSLPVFIFRIKGLSNKNKQVLFQNNSEESSFQDV